MRTFLIIMQFIAIILLVLETGYVFLEWKTRIQSYLFLICLSTLVNSIGYLFAIQATTLNEYMLGLKMSYFGRVWIPFSLLLFVNALCKRRNRKPVMAVLAIMHFSIFLLVATCEHHSLYYRNLSLDTSGIFPGLGMNGGIIHTLYTCILIGYIVYGIRILLCTTLSEKNPVRRRRLLFVLSAVLADSVFYAVEISGHTVGFDDTVLGYAVSSILMFIAIFRYSLLDTLKIVSDYVIDEVSEGIVVINRNNEIEYFNQPARCIFPQLDTYSPELVNSITESIERQTPLTVNDKIYAPKARHLVEEGSPAGTVFVLVDETEHYRYMDELKKQREIAEAANASKSAFLSIVSHEIRTPMNAVVGMADILLRDSESLSQKQEQYLKNIQTSGTSLVMIVNDILDQSKIEAGKMEIIEDSYELRPMLEDVRMIIENRIDSKPIRLEYDIDSSIPRFLIGDGLRIRQILINLMNNAVKFTEEGFIRLTISCTEDRGEKQRLRFSVQDSGQGIRAEDLTRLGQAFSQVDMKKNHSKEGTGLGLSISRDFIAMMGGRLEVASEYGTGSEFYFSIVQGVSDSNSVREEVEFTVPDARVLVVDDNEINLMIMEETLSTLGLTADTAASGAEAIELVKSNRYHMIFMDYMMPDLDGVETTERIRSLSESAAANGDAQQKEYYKAVPIIALTADTSAETREKFLRAGIDDFTDKPIDMKKLQFKISRWLPCSYALTP